MKSAAPRIPTNSDWPRLSSWLGARWQDRDAAERQRIEAELARQVALAAKAEREAAEKAVREAAEQAELEAMLKAEQKAARDARYAARKAAKKVRRRGY